MQIEILFAGLIALVLDPCPTTGPAERLHVMVMSVRDHRPRLAVDLRDAPIKMKTANGEIERTPPKDIIYYDGTQIGIWSLEGRNFCIENAPPVRLGDGNRDVDPKDPTKWKNDRPIDNDSPRHFSWFADLQRACSGKKLKMNALAKDFAELTSKAIFGVADTGSSLIVPTFDQFKQDVYRFDGDYAQVLPDGAQLHLDLPTSGGTVIRLKKRDAGEDLATCKASPNDDFVIPIQPHEVSQAAKITVSNLPLPEETSSKELAHFMHYYALLDLQGTACSNPKIRSSQPVKCTICSGCGTGGTKRKE